MKYFVDASAASRAPKKSTARARATTLARARAVGRARVYATGDARVGWIRAVINGLRAAQVSVSADADLVSDR